MRNRTSPQQAQELRRTMLEIIRAAGREGLHAALARDYTRQRMPEVSSAAIGCALTSLRRTGAIRGVGETKARVYIATTLASDTDVQERLEAAADIYAWRDLTSWPPKFQPRPDPAWMQPEKRT